MQEAAAPVKGTRRRGKLGDFFRAGYEYRVLELIVQGYKKMCEDRCYPEKEEEERFSAILADYIENCCPMYSMLTHQQWDVTREYYHDSEAVRKGAADPRKVPRIDIVVVRWKALGKTKEKFPFECKLLDEFDATSIRYYIEKGLIDRYLSDKNYAAESSWGGMIAYILRGVHDTIMIKLNEQIERQLRRSTDCLILSEPVADFKAIYKSQHQRPDRDDVLTVIHLLLSFPYSTKE